MPSQPCRAWRWAGSCPGMVLGLLGGRAGSAGTENGPAACKQAMAGLW